MSVLSILYIFHLIYVFIILKHCGIVNFTSPPFSKVKKKKNLLIFVADCSVDITDL